MAVHFSNAKRNNSLFAPSTACITIHEIIIFHIFFSVPFPSIVRLFSSSSQDWFGFCTKVRCDGTEQNYAWRRFSNCVKGKARTAERKKKQLVGSSDSWIVIHDRFVHGLACHFWIVVSMVVACARVTRIRSHFILYLFVPLLLFIYVFFSFYSFVPSLNRSMAVPCSWTEESEESILACCHWVGVRDDEYTYTRTNTHTHTYYRPQLLIQIN